MQTELLDFTFAVTDAVNIKRFGDGTIEYTFDGKTVRSTGTDLPTFLKGLVEALSAAAAELDA
jgi:hypothetical protein